MALTDFDRRRIELYLAGLHGPDPDADHEDDLRDTILCGACETRESIDRRYPDYFSNGLGIVYSTYIKQAQDFFAFVAPRSCFALCAADNRARFSHPTIVKSRLVADRDAKGVLLPLDRNRHWDDLLRVSQCDRPFEQKDDRLVWRGATTGVFNRSDESLDYSARYYVAFQKHRNANIDLKYSKLVQLDGCIDNVPIDLIWAHHDARGLTIAEQLGSKFLLCLEGNDVATGLKWMMASNSTVIMPAPTCETWFCEGELVPWEHYVPVEHDLSNVEEVHDWCLSNKGRCREIAENGKAFVSRFLDTWTEMSIIRTVVREYLDHSDVHIDFPSGERLAQVRNYARLQLRLARFVMYGAMIRRKIGTLRPGGDPIPAGGLPSGRAAS
ncbi:glycosyl transferase family 90 [Ancylobacter mangrovi]|uniref:glycosyl transferase family 90 n=1 Tax=Ancylobacter mangrovi TaxID=2972472 RepID=UPI002163C4B1|nr:glycosyl transferase family 90 [Ancylobacter mangrovi]MCS0500968.1 glycosyl transferase family 90 [Ancylobacter mangrovi]